MGTQTLSDLQVNTLAAAVAQQHRPSHPNRRLIERAVYELWAECCDLGVEHQANLIRYGAAEFVA